MDLSEKIIDKKEELLDEFENLSLDDIAKKIFRIERIVGINHSRARCGRCRRHLDIIRL